jgi:hypothetical protein
MFLVWRRLQHLATTVVSTASAGYVFEGGGGCIIAGFVSFGVHKREFKPAVFP